MKDFYTPHKEDQANANRSRTKENESRLKKPQKNSKKSLNTALGLVSEDVPPESKESSDFSPVSRIYDANYSTPISKSSVLAPTATPESCLLSDLPSTLEEPADMSFERYRFYKTDGSLEADIVADFLKQARTQVSNSDDVDQQSRKLLDALVKVVLDEFCALPEERDWCFEMVSKKGRVVFLCFLLWSLLVSVVFFFGFGWDSTHIGPSPT